MLTNKTFISDIYGLTAETGVSFRTDGWRLEAEGQTDVEVEIVI